LSWFKEVRYGGIQMDLLEDSNYDSLIGGDLQAFSQLRLKAMLSNSAREQMKIFRTFEPDVKYFPVAGQPV